MAQIHHLEVSHETTHVFDKDLGAIVRRQEMVRQSSVGTITHDGQVYEVDPDGSFYVPDDVAAFMLRTPNWHSGPSPFEPVGEEDPDFEPPANPPARKPRAKAGKA